MEENERVRELRKALGLTLEKFGEKVGVSKTAISKIEKSENSLTIQMAKSICREFNVDYFWLTEGKGEMFLETPDDIIDQVVEEYDLSEKAKIIIKAYIQMNDTQRECVENFFINIAEQIKKSE